MKILERIRSFFIKRKIKEHDKNFHEIFFNRWTETTNEQLRGVIIAKIGFIRDPIMHLGSDSKTLSLSGLDLSFLDLSGIDMSGLDLSMCIMAETNLRGANLSGCKLTNVYGPKVSFREANLSGARLLESNFSGADFRHADFSNAEISTVKMERCNLYGAKFNGARMENISFKYMTCVDGNRIREMFLDRNNPEGWRIFYGLGHIAIGCEQHSYNEWDNFTDQDIQEMDLNALNFWIHNKKFILVD